ncbi:MAG: hypothetical protein GY841_23620 [FCB group bacterium]|nr:hypothetical protein [FCB group bacterium]
MKTIIVIIMALLCAMPLYADKRVDGIFARFNEGDLETARQELRELPQSAARDGNRLFIAALLETDAIISRNMLKAAISSDLDGKYMEEAHFRLIQLAETSGNKGAVLTQSEEFLNRWEDSEYRNYLLAALAAHSGSVASDRKRYLNLLIDEYPGSYFGQYARLVKASAAYDRGHYKTATTLCRKINNSADDELVPASLIMLSRIALKNNDAGRALLNYDILREQYPYAIGQEHLISELRKTSDRQSGQESTEVFEGITYSVQVGVFSVKNNAKKMSERIKAYGQKMRTVKRKISDKTYHVVLAGKFTTLQEAGRVKEKLELGENQIFKVVVNDEK